MFHENEPGRAMSRPTIIIPYPGPSSDTSCREIFVYLRPETNGVLTESTILRVVEGTPKYRAGIELAYLANIPGEFIQENNVVENHYRHKMVFTNFGGSVFTSQMIERFERYFGCTFSTSRVLGAFDALDELDFTEEELFDYWVDESDVLQVNCQTIKKIYDIFVVNYDIPALIHKNSNRTDIAVMVFRSTLSSREFHSMIGEMGESLRDAGILTEGRPIRRVFHYSRGPFEQVLDARGHLYTENGSHVPLNEMQFCSFLQRKGIFCPEIEKILDNPIMEFRTDSGETREECLFVYTEDATYEEAYQILISATSQYYSPGVYKQPNEI